MKQILKNISDKAKSNFAEIPFPHRKDEFWRFADLAAWQTDALFDHFTKGVPQTDKIEKIIEIEDIANQENTISIFDGQLMSAQLCDGVEILPIANADIKYAKAVEDFYGAPTGKFDTLVASKADFGLLVVVKKGVEASLNLTSISKLGLSVSSLLFVLEANSKLRLVRHFATNTESFSLSHFKFVLDKDSRLELATFKHSGLKAHSYLKDDFQLEEGSNIIDGFAELSKSPTRTERNFEMIAPYSEIDTRVFLDIEGGITHDLRTAQMHRVGNAMSNLAVKSVVKDTSKLAFAGVIRVEEEAQATKSYQSCRSLSMSDKAKTQTSPILEIMANDVECSHGCTVSKPDEEEIFYMNQRGLSNYEALGLITKGFAQSTFEKLGIEI